MRGGAQLIDTLRMLLFSPHVSLVSSLAVMSNNQVVLRW